VDAEGEREVPIHHKASRQVDSQHVEFSLGNPESQACAAVEIEPE